MEPRSSGVLAASILAGSVLLVLLEPVAGGSCGAAKLCCQGRDSGCVIQKASPNAIIESPRDKPCYCDHACLRLGDCCSDFNETCAVSDCSLSDWSEWTECNNKCGLGAQSRRRFIVRPERNGGKPCPKLLEQSLTCQNYDACRRRARHYQVEELASLSSMGRSNDSSDNGPETSLDSNFVPQITRGYCAAFTILKISRGCRRRLESFHEGSRVCVWCRAQQTLHPSSSSSISSNGLRSTRSLSSCQLDASFAGIGRWELLASSSSSSSSSAVKHHCHGKWIAAASASVPYVQDSCSEALCAGRPLLAFL